MGLCVMFIAAPFSYCFYIFFEGSRTVFIGDWFHSNLFHFFFLIRFQISGVIGLVGLYIYLEQDRRVKVLAPAIGFLLMSLVLNVFADSNDDVWDLGSFVLWGACTCLSLVILYGIDYFTWRKFHKQDGFERRFETIFNGLEQGVVTDREAVESFLTTMREKKSFNAKG